MNSAKFIFIVFILSACNASQQKENVTADKQPNIIFIMSDDHAYQAISAYGDSINHTPNIDLLAKEGMIFNRAFVNNSLCAPSRAAILPATISIMQKKLL